MQETYTDFETRKGPLQYADHISQFFAAQYLAQQQGMKIFNGVCDVTEKDQATMTMYQLRGQTQRTIFERQERRRRDYERKQMAEILISFAIPVAALVILGTILYFKFN